MDPRVARIIRVFRWPEGGRNCPVGHRWFDDPHLVQINHRIANVLEYVEAEFGIPAESEREEFIAYLKDIHSGFGWRLAQGESLEAIQFP